MQKFYQRHLDRFDIQEKVRVAHIFFRVAQDADEKTRKNTFKKAQDVLEKARKGEDFAALAKNFSDDKETAESGGELGEFFRGNLTPPLERAAFSLEAGGISEIVETTFGYHILKLNRIIPPRKISFKEVKTDILNALLKIEVEKKKKKYLSELRKSAKIKILL